MRKKITPWLRPGLLGLLGLLVSMAPAQVASACLAREPIRRVIQASLPQIRRCMASHHYVDGTYVMHFEIRGDGAVENVALYSGPALPSPTASRCLIQVFSQLRFTPLYSSARRPRSPAAPPRVNGRISRVPPGPRQRRLHASRVGVNYPLIFRGSSGSAAPQDAPRHAPPR